MIVAVWAAIIASGKVWASCESVGSSGASGVTCGVCGDGNLDPGEDCDDGNTLAGDCCSPTCRNEESVRGNENTTL